jgi:hypothetical protein
VLLQLIGLQLLTVVVNLGITILVLVVHLVSILVRIVKALRSIVSNVLMMITELLIANAKSVTMTIIHNAKDVIIPVRNVLLLKIALFVKVQKTEQTILIVAVWMDTSIMVQSVLSVILLAKHVKRMR